MSSGVAVGRRKHIGLSESCEDDTLPKELKARFSVKHVGAICKGGFHLCSGYLHTAVGINHKLNLDWLQAAAGVLSTLKGPKVAVLLLFKSSLSTLQGPMVVVALSF